MTKIRPCGKCGEAPTFVPYEQSTDGNHDRPARVVCRCGNVHNLTWDEFHRAKEGVPPEKRGAGYMSRDEIEAINDAVIEAWNCEQDEGYTPELLPCPFCGGSAEIITTHIASGIEFAEAVCRRCYAAVHSNGEFATEEEASMSAAQGWNHRVERTCHYVGDEISGGCSECRGWLDLACAYCPSCGARVEEEA